MSHANDAPTAQLTNMIIPRIRHASIARRPPNQIDQIKIAMGSHPLTISPMMAPAFTADKRDCLTKRDFSNSQAPSGPRVIPLGTPSHAT